MALSFTEGSIGGDIERVNLDSTAVFYGNGPVSGGLRRPCPEDRGAARLERHGGRALEYRRDTTRSC